MKKRIISGVIMGAIVALVLIFGLTISNVIITVFVAAIAAMAVWELVFNALGVKWLPFQIIPMAYTTVSVWLISRWLENTLRMQEFFSGAGSAMELDSDKINIPVVIALITVVFFVAMAVLTLIKQSELDLTRIFALATMPLFISFAFATLGSIITASDGIYYLLLVLNFSSVCDMGAYFVGVSMGKTKLCPNISPKKTVEGALGGIVSSVIVSLVITLCFGHFVKILPVVLLTIPLCAAGMVGDLFASIIKRKVGIKDYGDLIPGHGGVLDRADSILFISPLVYGLVFLGAI